MENKNILSLITLICILFIQTGCKKAADFYTDLHLDVKGRYQVKNVSFTTGYGPEAVKSYDFFYSDDKKLARIQFGEYDRIEFAYNPQGKLRKMMTLGYSAKYGDYDRADLFAYPDSNTIIQTIYYGGQIWEPIWGLDSAVKVMKLDAKGRIIWEKTTVATRYSGEIKGRILTYSYDADGNRIIPGVTYTKKPSIRKLDDVFMLLDRNYSVNTASDESDQFNTPGLPLRLKRNKRDFLSLGYSNFKNNSIQDVVVEYTRLQ